MADIYDVLGGIAQNVAGAYLQKRDMKAAQKLANSQVAIARYQAKAASVMPTMGMGYAATPLSAGYVPAGGMSVAMPASYTQDVGRALQIAPDSLVGGIMGLRSRSNRVTNPRTGQADTCLLWASDLVAVRRVGRVAKKLGRFIHRRPR